MGDVIASLSDPDVRVRRAAVDLLETLDREAAPAAGKLVQALADPDRFVRWSAARVLGKLAPAEPTMVVPGLTRLLNETDLDVRISAAQSIAQYGPAAKLAVPALTSKVTVGDPESRVAAIHALQSIGKDSEMAIPAVTLALGHGDLRVRMAAAEFLGQLGPMARSAVGALRVAMLDEKLEVRSAAGDALLDLGPAAVLDPPQAADAPQAIVTPQASNEEGVVAPGPGARVDGNPGGAEQIAVPENTRWERIRPVAAFSPASPADRTESPNRWTWRLQRTRRANTAR